MITRDTFKDLLRILNFEESNEVFHKAYQNGEVSLSVDFTKKIIIYPENKGLIVNERQTTNFSSNENFVVFECVNRLLAKGYKPEHIELEPKWQVGHSQSGGRADIVIKDNYGKALIIIECKTEGREFNEAWKRMLLQPSQLFSYAQQIKSTQFVCLYASDIENNNITYNNFIITLKDNDKLLEEFVGKEPLSYKNAQEVDDIYKVWKHTYAQDFATKGLFEADIQAYEIGKTKFNINDLSNVSSKDIQGKYHEFATILRQHNVSGRENAFDKLVNLFLCKVVDESEHSDDLQFYWKGIAYDNYFDLIDRLQRLYKIGMDKFLEEEVTYVDEKSIDEAFRYFKNDRDATKDTIKNYFRQLKFFTNSDFAFIDVHNEKLFYQNAEVLLKMVKMLQDIRLLTSEQNQFLGDMFEGFLDQGIKQSEGQFFTPMPIVKFILNSLPLEQLIESNEIPKVIDYACGAGHFLNEYATQIKPIIERVKEININEYYPEILGIEKEYRLSKVAKVSSFMYGQDDINIIYSDALGHTPSIKDGTFSLLVANPPYSVKGFLETLSPLERKKYELINSIDSKSYANNNSIETFFIERAKQLLKPGGIAAIIVPSSIISKGNHKVTSKKQNIYVATREILFKYFDIIAIAALGRSTFGKTGTNTVTLFLRRREENPSLSEQFDIRINSWFNGDESKDKIFEDDHYLKMYCNHIDIEFNDYKSLLNRAPSEKLLNHETFVLYKKEFQKSTDTVNKIKQKTFKSLPENQREAELTELFIEYCHRIEKDKLFYFILASHNANEVIIIKSPTENTAEKKFLGYEWSAAKGKEGIKYLGNAKVQLEEEEDEEEGIVAMDDDDKRVLGNILNLGTIQTPLYDPKDRNNSDKINSLIKSNFNNEPIQIPDDLMPFVTHARVIDMLDFKRNDFNKAISLNSSRKSIVVNSIWPLDNIDNIASVKKGKAITKKDTKDGDVKVVAGGMDFAYFHNIANREKGVITISASGANAGYVNYWDEKIFASDCTTVQADSIVDTLYIFNYLKTVQNEIFLLARGAAQPHVYPDDIKNLKIPIPEPAIKAKIVEECQILESKVKENKKLIDSCNLEIENAISQLYRDHKDTKKISDPTVSILNPSKKEIANLDGNKIVSFVEMASVSDKGYIANKEDRPYKDLKLGSYTYFKEGDLIFAKITPCMENGKCAIAEGLTNEIGLGSSEFHVVRVQPGYDKKFIFILLNRESIRKEAEKNMTGSSGHRRVPISFYEDILIPTIPPNLQTKFVAKIEKIKDQINKATSFITGVNELKKQILTKYL